MCCNRPKNNSTVYLFCLPQFCTAPFVRKTCSSLGKSVLCDVTRGSDAPPISGSRNVVVWRSVPFSRELATPCCSAQGKFGKIWKSFPSPPAQQTFLIVAPLKATRDYPTTWLHGVGSLIQASARCDLLLRTAPDTVTPAPLISAAVSRLKGSRLCAANGLAERL